MENKYEILKESILGEGAFGKVFLGRNKDNYFAIKHESINLPEYCLANEIAVLQDL